MGGPRVDGKEVDPLLSGLPLRPKETLAGGGYLGGRGDPVTRAEMGKWGGGNTSGERAEFVNLKYLEVLKVEINFLNNCSTVFSGEILKIVTLNIYYKKVLSGLMKNVCLQ